MNVSRNKPDRKRIQVTVISDLVTDQRVHKVCQTLHDAGYAITLTGAARKGSLPMDERDYTTHRIRLLFQHKIFFYAEFNTRLFFRLLFSKTDILLGNDLDVMAATWLAGWLKKKPVVYDSHEYYLEMAGLDNKPVIKNIWRRIEQKIFPRVSAVYTVCDSICRMYETDYHRPLRAVRNVPYKNKPVTNEHTEAIAAIDARIPRNKKILLFQGAGINPHRGVEELVLAMTRLDPEKFHLLIIGSGDIIETIKRLIAENTLHDRITLIPKQPFAILEHFTRQADLGLSIDKPDNINHRFGLPNKIFDYLHAGLPVLVSRLIEVEKIVLTYDVGDFIENHDPSHIAERIQYMLADDQRLDAWKTNTIRARNELNWEIEGKIVIDIFKQVQSTNG